MDNLVCKTGGLITSHSGGRNLGATVISVTPRGRLQIEIKQLNLGTLHVWKMQEWWAKTRRGHVPAAKRGECFQKTGAAHYVTLMKGLVRERPQSDLCGRKRENGESEGCLE